MVHGGGLRWKEIWHCSATRRTTQTGLFALHQKHSWRHLMTFLPKQWFIFCLSMRITLNWPQASLLVLWKGFPHTPPSMWEKYYFGTVPHLYKDTRVDALSEHHTNTIHQQVWEEIIFFLSKEGCYIWSVWGKCNKSCWQGAFSLQEDFLAQQRKEENEVFIQLAVQRHLYSWIHSTCLLLNECWPLIHLKSYES